MIYRALKLVQSTNEGTGKTDREWREIGYFQGDRATIERYVSECHNGCNPRLDEVEPKLITADHVGRLLKAAEELRNAQATLEAARKDGVVQ